MPQDSQCCQKIRYRQRLCRFDRVPLEGAGDHDPPAVISDLRFQIGLRCKLRSGDRTGRHNLKSSTCQETEGGSARGTQSRKRVAASNFRLKISECDTDYCF